LQKGEKRLEGAWWASETRYAELGPDSCIDLPDQNYAHLNFPPLRSRVVGSGAELVGQPGFDGGFWDGVLNQGGRRHDVVRPVCLDGG
jgi:hypothetical protein